MATGFLDLTIYSVGENVLSTSDFSIAVTFFGSSRNTMNVIENAALPESRGLEVPNSEMAAGTVFSWDDGPSFVDGQVLVLAFRSAGGERIIPGSCARIQAASGCYFAGLRNESLDATLREAQDDNGEVTVANSASSATSQEGEWIWIRQQFSGQEHRVRVWDADLQAADYGASNEPSTWDIDTTDAALTNAGTIGLLVRETASQSGFLRYGWLSYSDSTIEDAPFPAGQVSGEISGFYQLQDGTAVPNVDVYAVRIDVGGSETVNRVQTGVDGGYVFTGLDAGTYSVHAIDPNNTDASNKPFATQALTVTVD